MSAIGTKASGWGWQSPIAWPANLAVSFCFFAENLVAASSCASPGSTGALKTVLLVEDDPSTRLPMRLLLARAGWHVLEAATIASGVVELRTESGMGRTSVLERFHESRGGAFLDMRTVMDAMAQAHPLAIEETLYHRLVAELSAHSLVIVDDMQLLMHMVVGCGSYPRSHYLAATIVALATLLMVFSTGLLLTLEGLRGRAKAAGGR